MRRIILALSRNEMGLFCVLGPRLIDQTPRLNASIDLLEARIDQTPSLSPISFAQLVSKI